MNLDQTNEFLLKYPGLLQLTDNPLAFVGNVKVQGKWYRLRMACPHFPTAHQLKLTVQSGLTVTEIDSKEFDSNWTVTRVMDQLPCLLHSQNPVKSAAPTLDVYETQNEILQLQSPSYKIHTNSQCNVVRFSEIDHFKGHYLEVRLNKKNKFVLFDHSLPDGVQWEELFRASNSIGSILTQFLNYLDELGAFYTNLTDIDELCYVVQPLQPTTKENWRMFKLKEKVFVKLALDPFTSSPALVNVIGPTYEVESLRNVLSEGLKNWDTEMDVHANLLRTFELTYFPMANEGSEQFCNICYCYHQLEGHIPIISCDNRNCSLVFHAMCLKEWFTMLTDGMVFLDVAFGACPFCKEKLSTTFADVLK